MSALVDEAFFMVTSSFDFWKLADRLRGAYVRRRAEFLSKQSSFTATKLADQLDAELTVVANYLKTKEAITKGTETGFPPHLNLTLAAVQTIIGNTIDLPRLSKLLEADSRLFREYWILMIVWRALTVHGDKLWKSIGPPPKLQQAALDELLDRRLDAVEQMHHNVNSSGYGLNLKDRHWQVSGAKGPWRDGHNIRNFEYPALPPGPFKEFLPQMKDWQDKFGLVLVFTPPPGQAPIHFPAAIRSAWLVKKTHAGTLWVTYQPSTSKTTTEVFERMFGTPREDFLDRNWMFCDMIGSAVQIHALWFGLHRRHGNDDLFEETTNKANYTRLGPVVRFSKLDDLDMLMRDAEDKFFENTDVEIDDLQVGDFVCFWSSRLFDLIWPLIPGPWGNEFSYVMEIDVDGKTGKVPISANGPDVRLEGHGIHSVSYN